MKRRILKTAVGVISLTLAGAVTADEIYFQFENPGAVTPDGTDGVDFNVTNTCNGVNISSTDICETGSGLTYTVDGQSVTVTGNNSDGDGLLMQDLWPRNSGLAVVSPGEAGRDDQVQADEGEFVLFDFGRIVELLSIDFNAGNDRDCVNANTTEGPCGSFELYIDGVMVDLGSIFGSDEATDDIIFGGLFGTVFRIVATGTGKDEPSGFAIGSIKISVPTPGAAILLLSGLAGLGLARRRRVG